MRQALLSRFWRGRPSLPTQAPSGCGLPRMSQATTVIGPSGEERAGLAFSQQCLAFFLLYPCQPLYGAQGMVGHGCAFRVGPGDQGAKATVSKMAACEAQCSDGVSWATPRGTEISTSREWTWPSPFTGGGHIERARVRVAQKEAAVQLLDVEDPALPPLREALIQTRLLRQSCTLPGRRSVSRKPSRVFWKLYARGTSSRQRSLQVRRGWPG